MSFFKLFIILFFIATFTKLAFGQGSGGGGGGEIEAVAATCAGASCTATANCSAGKTIITDIKDWANLDVLVHDEGDTADSWGSPGFFGGSSANVAEMTLNNQAAIAIQCF